MLSSIFLSLKCIWINSDSNTKLTAIISSSAIVISIFTLVINSIINKRQNIESNIFKMFDNLRNIIDFMKQRTPNSEPLEGREYLHWTLQNLIRVFKNGIEEKNRELLEKNGNEDIEAKRIELLNSRGYLNEKYLFFFANHSNNLSHYFRFIYNIFKYIIESNFSDKRKSKYIGMLQAQLSNDELGLLFYNCISDKAEYKNGEGKFFNWLEKYNFLENIDDNCIVNREHLELYPKTKFKLKKSATIFKEKKININQWGY